MSSHRETILLVSSLAVVAALFPAFFSYSGKSTPAPPVIQHPATPSSSTSDHVRALVPYLLAVPRAIISVPSKPLAAIASSLALVAAPALVVLDALLFLVALPFRALSVVIGTIYPIYVLCGAAILTGIILGGMVVGLVKFILLVQEVRQNRAEMEEHKEWQRRRHSSRRREDYY